ncbi:hypothetical protein AWC01_09170 [Mycobacterium doricum]|uniref:Uncharacterized protein n=1 Tax=Mycolicibacterium doricum TaxID=126673 RepID=A0A1X1TC20_9MYCO|nr:hypothetical protein AWC01_09170 [Mycolicibacterium doricum]
MGEQEHRQPLLYILNLEPRGTYVEQSDTGYQCCIDDLFGGKQRCRTHRGGAQEEPTMPDVVDMHLDEAQEAVVEASGDPDLVLNSLDVKGPSQKHLVRKWWKVCWQAPEAGEPLADV